MRMEFAAACIPAICLLGRATIERHGGLIASLLLALNAFHVQYAQEVRAYSLLALTTTLSSYFFWKAIHGRSQWDWTFYAITGAIGLYAHTFAALVIASQYAFLILWRRQAQTSLALPALNFGIMLLMAAPVIAFLARQSQHGPLGWLSPPTIWTVFDAIRNLSGNGSRILTLVYVVLCVTAFVRFRHREQSSAIHYFAVCLLLPFTAALLFSITAKPIFHVRYLIICMPPFVMLAASGISAFTKRPTRIAIITVLAILAVRSLTAYYSSSKEGWRDATQYVLANARADDGIVFDPPLSRFPVEYYVRLFHAEDRSPRPVFPAAAWGEVDPILPDAPENAEAALRALQSWPPRLWLVTRGSLSPPTTFEHRTQIDQKNLPNVTVRLFAVSQQVPDQAQ